MVEESATLSVSALFSFVSICVCPPSGFFSFSFELENHDFFSLVGLPTDWDGVCDVSSVSTKYLFFCDVQNENRIGDGVDGVRNDCRVGNGDLTKENVEEK